MCPPPPQTIITFYNCTQKAIADSPLEAKVTWAHVKTTMAPLLQKVGLAHGAMFMCNVCCGYPCIIVPAMLFVRSALCEVHCAMCVALCWAVCVALCWAVYVLL